MKNFNKIIPSLLTSTFRNFKLIFGENKSWEDFIFPFQEKKMEIKNIFFSLIQKKSSNWEFLPGMSGRVFFLINILYT